MRRPGAALLAAALVAVGVTWVQSVEPASAALRTETWSQLWCNANIHNVDAGNVDLFVSCQMSVASWNGFDSDASMEFAVRDSFGAPGVTNWISRSMDAPSYTTALETPTGLLGCASLPGSYRLRCKQRFTVGGAYEAAPQASVAGPWGSPRSGRSALFEVTQVATGFPVYPTDHYDGGTDGGYPRTGLPASYDCWRELRDLGGAELAVDLHAVLLNPDNPSGVVDDEGYWTVTYDEEIHADGRDVTLHLPAPADRPAGGMVAVFHSERELPVDVLGRIDLNEDGNWQIDPESGTGRYLSGERAGALNDFAAWMDVNTRKFANALAGFFGGNGEAVDTSIPMDEWTTEWRTSTVDCGVVLDQAAPAAVTENRVELVPPGGTPAPSGRAESGECAGFGGSIPFIGGIIKAVSQLVCELRNLIEGALRWAFIPTWDACGSGGDEAPWCDLNFDDAFPFNLWGSIIGPVTDLLEGAVDGAAGGNACGPRLAFGEVVKLQGEEVPALNLRLPTPSDSGCPSMTEANAARTDLDDAIGDLYGWRVWVKALATLTLAVVVVTRVMSAFNGGDTGLEAV